MRTKVDVFVRSEKQEMVSRGVYEYTYTKFSDVPATIKSNMSNISFDSQSINATIPLSTELQFIIPNDITQRVYRVQYIKMGGSLYDVGINNYYYPNIVSRLNGISKIDETKLKIK